MHNQLSEATDFQLQIKNTISNPQLVESVDAKSGDVEGLSDIYWKTSAHEGT